jgi:TIR domain
MGQGIFLSYSRRDAGIVRKVRLIIWAARMNPWRDEEDIPPGDKWRLAITKSVEECERMLVFWCRHSSASMEVRREYEAAIARYRPVVPVLMDGTAVNDALEEYQHIDVRDLVWFSHRVGRVENVLWIAGLVLLIAAFVVTRRIDMPLLRGPALDTLIAVRANCTIWPLSSNAVLAGRFGFALATAVELSPAMVGVGACAAAAILTVIRHIVEFRAAARIVEEAGSPWVTAAPAT